MIDFGHLSGCAHPDCSGCDPDFWTYEELQAALQRAKNNVLTYEKLLRKRQKEIKPRTIGR